MVYPEQAPPPGPDPQPYPPAGQPPAPGYPSTPGYPSAPGYPTGQFPAAGQPGGYPTGQLPAAGQPGGYPTGHLPAVGYPGGQAPMAGSPAVPARGRVPVPLLIINGALALALIAALAIVLTQLGGLHGDTGAAQAQRDAMLRADAQAQSALRDQFQQAGLPGRLDQVRQLTSAAQETLLKWNGLPADQQSAQIHTIQDAINRCDLAIFDYDSTASRFPASVVQAAGLPLSIDTSDSATDCGRID